MHDDCLKRERERHGKKDMMKMQKKYKQIHAISGA
jgi:hypothetical protein